MSLRAADLADKTGLELLGDGDVTIDHVATMANANAGGITFLSNPAYRVRLSACKASAIIVRREDAEACTNPAVMISENPYLSYALCAQILYPVQVTISSIHKSAQFESSDKFAKDVRIGPQACIGNDVVLGQGVSIGSGTVIADGVVIGAHTRIGPNVTILEGCKLGERCIIHPGVVIGADGFGFANDGGVWVKIPQVGRVVIGDDVEVGANSTIDRGAIEDTTIGNGVKLDNQIQIGHNCVIGDHTAIAGCSGIAGSAVIGKNCSIGGYCGIAGHLTIADGCVITGKSMVTHSLTKGEYSSGLPVQQSSKWRRNVARLRQLDNLFSRVKTLEKQNK